MSTQSKTKIIAIDGMAASGKGTAARRVADALGYAFIDTGALYRCVAKACLESGISLEDEGAITKTAQNLNDRISLSDFSDPAIRTEAVSSAASKVSKYPKMRAALLQLQQDLAQNPPDLADGTAAKGAVLDGRDIGTVVCPNADFKFFLRASAEIRADRRYKELQSKGITCTYDAVLQEMVERDARDSDREVAPMKPAPDAIVVDTSNLDSDQVFDLIMNTIKSS